MLDIPKRIEIIESLLKENTTQSITYAALESRLTLEYLCYERFKLVYGYLSEEDLINWQPKHIVNQISKDIDEYVDTELTLQISKLPLGDKLPKTKEDYESIEYVTLGRQSQLNVKKLNKLWHSLSNVALHIPVPNIASGELRIYGDKKNITKKINDVITFLSLCNGNLLVGGHLGLIYSFPCSSCNALIKKPTKYLDAEKIVYCINPKCNESYIVEPTKNDNFDHTRRIIKLQCNKCKVDLDIPTNTFKNLKFKEALNINCECGTSKTVVMRPQEVK